MTVKRSPVKPALDCSAIIGNPLHADTTWCRIRRDDSVAQTKKTARKKTGGRKKAGKPAIWRWIRRLVFILFTIALIPLALTPLYRLPAVHPVSTLMLKNWLAGSGVDRRWVPIDEISPQLVYAVMMSEDAKFCAHSGIDWGAMNAVIEDALEGEPTRGASTIPMQTAKNLFLWQSRSFVRKIIEAPLALYVDAVLPKKRIMEIYLNIAEWAPGVYGAEAAARRHFKRSAARLTLNQAALLAVTLPNPHVRNPAAPSRGLRRLADRVAGRARQAGAYVGCVRDTGTR